MRGAPGPYPPDGHGDDEDGDHEGWVRPPGPLDGVGGVEGIHFRIPTEHQPTTNPMASSSTTSSQV